MTFLESQPPASHRRPPVRGTEAASLSLVLFKERSQGFEQEQISASEPALKRPLSGGLAKGPIVRHGWLGGGGVFTFPSGYSTHAHGETEQPRLRADGPACHGDSVSQRRADRQGRGRALQAADRGSAL